MTIFCSQCGAENYDTSSTCFNCQSPIARLKPEPGYQQNQEYQQEQGYPQEDVGYRQNPDYEQNPEYYQDPGYQQEPGYQHDPGYQYDPGYQQEQSHQQGKGSSLRIRHIAIGVVCLIYLINPTAGIIELIPDNIPFIGNLDEAAAVTGLLMALSNLGVIPWRRTEDQ
ncbi:MAG: DUF1232 domain-containing protein [Chloroflexota bacterium]